MAAGLLLIEEAGGKYSGMHGEPHRLDGANVVGDNGLIHDEIVCLFEEIFSGQYRVPIPTIAG